MNGAASIEINQVSKTFPGHRGAAGLKALDNASFSIAPGEFVCILGPSGCGKSTLLNILSGLDENYEGSAAIDPSNENVRQKIEEVRVDVPSLLSRALIASASEWIS